MSKLVGKAKARARKRRRETAPKINAHIERMVEGRRRLLELGSDLTEHADDRAYMREATRDRPARRAKPKSKAARFVPNLVRIDEETQFMREVPRSNPKRRAKRLEA